MFRSAAPRVAWFVLVSLATVPLAATSVGAAEDHVVTVRDDGFQNPDPKITAGDSVTWALHPSATQTHWIAIDLDNNGDIDEQEEAFGQALSRDGTPTFTWTFADAAPSDPYDYVCVLHEQQGMKGTVLVNESPPPSSSTTTTTTEPPATTTTTTEPPTTTTTAQPTTTTRPSTTTTRPPATTTTRPTTTTEATEPSQSNSGSTNNTGRATTTTEPSTTTTERRARTPRSTETTGTTGAPDPTTTTLDPALVDGEWIPRPDKVLGGQATTSTTGSGDEAASSAGEAGGGGSGGGGLPIVPLAGALGVGLLGAGAWAWYHRSSRYLSA